ncbi:MAG: DUF445 domain-containing protein [Myxococcota bacterium]
MANWVILLLLFPLICGVIGYLTNLVAVKMIFRPYERVSFMGIGFQGVLAKHQEHFARMLAAVIVRDLVGAGDLVEELAKPEAVDQLEGAAKTMAKAMVEELRETLPEPKRAMLGDATIEALMGQVAVAMRAEVPTIIAHLKAEADAQLDLEEIVAQKLISLGAKGLEDVIYEISRRELVFIEIYGAVFGAMLGFLQFGVLWVLGDIALPIVGALVGTVTNWLAIQMLFYPRQKKRYLGIIEYQGMFPARQQEIAAGLGSVAARDFIVPTEIFKNLAAGVVPEDLEQAHIEGAEAWLREKIPPVGQVLDGMLSEEERDSFRAEAVARFPELRTAGFGELASVAGDKVNVAGILASRLQAMDKGGFEGIIRGLFEREELYLIIYGGLLGGVMGFLQLLVVLALR